MLDTASVGAARDLYACPLERAATRLGLSARACHRTLKVARSIADLAGEDRIGRAALAEALGYRRLDRRGPIVQGL